jgi:hypothetical protein
MGLSSDDKRPIGISLQDAYIKFRTWFKHNVRIAIDRGDEYGIQSSQLIDALPYVKVMSDLEIRIVLSEVICGNLEWGYHKDDGNFKMAAYASAALEGTNFTLSVTTEEMEKLKSSVLWPYLNINRKNNF